MEVDDDDDAEEKEPAAKKRKPIASINKLNGGKKRDKPQSKTEEAVVGEDVDKDTLIANTDEKYGHRKSWEDLVFGINTVDRRVEPLRGSELQIYWTRYVP